MTARSTGAALAALSCVAALGCVEAVVPEGRYVCAADGECPDGFRCVAARCSREGPGTDAGARDGGGVDGGLDAGARDDGGSDAGGASTCGDGTVGPGETCDDGHRTGCGACNEDCSGAGSGSRCGDGSTCHDTEACDDGGDTGGDGCAADCGMVETGWVCSGEPSRCAMTCGNGALDPDEGCDDGANRDGDGCSAACVTERGYTCVGEPSTCSTECGDGVVAGAEECDDSDLDSMDGCSSACEQEEGWTCSGEPTSCSEICGDAMVVGMEACDDGNTVDETQCAYGTATCSQCDATCRGTLSLSGNVCGDGLTAAGHESCDDGDMSPNDGCDASCAVEAGWRCVGASESICFEDCGDGSIVGLEACDDANSLACGLCSADCRTATVPVPAAGTITVSSGDASLDTASFSLDDGAGTVVSFEIDRAGDGAGGGRVPVPIPPGSGNQPAVAMAVVTAINGQAALRISASSVGAIVTLTNEQNGEQGNVPIGESTAGTGPWTFTGMAGGVGRTCSDGTGCTDGDDCRSGRCASGVCSP